MRIAVNCRSPAGRRFGPELLLLRDLIDNWQSGGDEVILIGPPDVAGLLPDDLRRVDFDPETSRWRRAVSPLWGAATLAADVGADVLFIPEPAAPLVAPLPIAALLSRRRMRPTSFTQRIHIAAGRAGLSGTSALLTLDDLPSIEPKTRSVRILPAFVGPAFTPQPERMDGDRLRTLDLAPGYCLAFGTSADELRVLLAAWSWVAGALGDEYPLVIVGGGGVSAEEAHAMAATADVDASLRWVERVSAEVLPALFRGADALLHAGPTSIGQELRWALACGVPIAGVETAETSAVIGEAGYLVASSDTRALGAACLTVIVDADVAGVLKERGLARARVYHEPSSRQAWVDVFHSILASDTRQRHVASLK